MSNYFRNPELVGDPIIEAIEQLQADVAELKNKSILLLGDSYSQGYQPDAIESHVTSWSDYFTQWKKANWMVKTLNEGGIGFDGRNGETGHDLAGLLNWKYTQEPTYFNGITDIIIAFGYNDNASSKANILIGMSDVNTFFTTHCAGARVHLMAIGWDKRGSVRKSLFNAYNAAYRKSIEYGWQYYNRAYTVMANTTAFCSDMKHPTADAQIYIGRNVYNLFTNGEYLKGLAKGVGKYDNQEIIWTHENGDSVAVMLTGVAFPVVASFTLNPGTNTFGGYLEGDNHFLDMDTNIGGIACTIKVSGETSTYIRCTLRIENIVVAGVPKNKIVIINHEDTAVDLSGKTFVFIPQETTLNMVDM